MKGGLMAEPHRIGNDEAKNGIVWLIGWRHPFRSQKQET
jgi:hypothetical protein